VYMEAGVLTYTITESQASFLFLVLRIFGAPAFAILASVTHVASCGMCPSVCIDFFLSLLLLLRVVGAAQQATSLMFC
jgi:hypothetical protein